MIAAAIVQFTRNIKLAVVLPRSHREGGSGEKGGDQEAYVFHIWEAKDRCGIVTSQTRGRVKHTLPRPPFPRRPIH